MLKVYQQDNKPPVIVPSWKVPFLRIHSFVWNLCRRPLVAKWKNDVERIAVAVQEALKEQLLPELYDNLRAGCPSCRDLYGFLRGAKYVSQIRQVVTKEYCRDHFEPYLQFGLIYDELFKQSHELSDKICGFKSNYK